MLLAVVAVAWLLISEASANLARRNLTFGFGFFADRTNFDIPFRLISWSESDTYARALLVCLLNTLLVSGLSIVTATMLGVLLGVMRLSINWLVRNIALAFIEFVRNTPQLVQIIFWYIAVLQTLPAPRQSIVLPGGLLLNIRGLYLPDPVLGPNGVIFAAIAGALVLATPFAWGFARRRGHRGLGSLILPLLGLALYAAGIDHIDWPTPKGFNIAGGTQLPPELVAVWAGLSIYSSAFIAEIVRGSIQAIPIGQDEASAAMGLRFGQRLFLVILPQALRIMVPQLTSQYLNIIKSSTLGAAVAYPEIFQIFAGTVMQQTGKEIETILVVMIVFLVINLLASLFMNWYNRRITLVER